VSLSEEATERLLRAAASLRLIERRRAERFGLGPLGAAMIGNPGIAAMVEHHRLLYHDLQDPVALLRGEQPDTELARYWPYAASDRPADLTLQQVDAYSALMAASQPLVAEEVLDAYPLGRHRCLLDVGGGEGAFLAAAAARSPQLQLILFDLPAVAERGEARLAASGLAGRTTAVGGDFRTELPAGADVVSLVRIVHDHDDATALAVLRAARRALPPDGTLLLAEPMSGTPGAEPVSDAYFGFYLLAMGRGRPRTPDELRTLLQAAGFDRVRLVPTRRPLLTRLMVGKPA
jgi:demethylspheroidene O-methyltransferase